MIIVSDTTAITSLLQIGRLDILPALYEKVIIPQEVANELKRFHSEMPNFIAIQPVTNPLVLQKLKNELDPGEAAAIALMLEGVGNLLLMDEKSGRQVAQREGLNVIGLMGVLLDARKRGIVSSLSDLIANLEQVAGFRISPRLKQHVLQAAGEN